MPELRISFNCFRKVHHFGKVSVIHFLSCPVWLPFFRSFKKIKCSFKKLEESVWLIFFIWLLYFSVKFWFIEYWIKSTVLMTVRFTLRKIRSSLFNFEIYLNFMKVFFDVLFFSSLLQSKVESAIFIIVFLI